MPNLWTDVDEVRDRALGVDEDFTDAQIDRLIGDAEDIVLAAFPLIESQVPGDIPVARVARVVASMVIRRLRNPDGIRTLQDSTGPFAGSTTFAGDAPGELALTDDDRRALTVGGGTGRRAFSVRPNYLRG